MDGKTINCPNCEGKGCAVCCWNGWIPADHNPDDYIYESDDNLVVEIKKIGRKSNIDKSRSNNHRQRCPCRKNWNKQK